AVCRFVKADSRVFFDDIPIWLTRTDWTPLAEVQVLSQRRSRDPAGRPRVEGEFQVLYRYPAAGQEALKGVFVRRFARPGRGPRRRGEGERFTCTERFRPRTSHPGGSRPMTPTVIPIHPKKSEATLLLERSRQLAAGAGQHTLYQRLKGRLKTATLDGVKF